MNPSQQHTQRNRKVSNAVAHNLPGSSSVAVSLSRSSDPIQLALYTFDEAERSRDQGGRAHLPRTIEGVEFAENDPTNEARALGLGEDRSQQITRINWGPLVANDGSSMSAVLGPDHKKGSEPGDSGLWVDKRKDLQQKSGGHKYIAGHLLNHELGGPGDLAQNLAAIPEETNKNHNTGIEEKVKDEVNKKGAWGNYTVSITHRQDEDGTIYAARLTAEWKPQGIVSPPNEQQRLVESKGEKRLLILQIPPPSAFAQNKRQKIVEHANPWVRNNDQGPDQLVTPFRFNELPLDSFTSKISAYGHSNVVLIQRLQERQLVNEGVIEHLKQELIARTNQLKEQFEEYLDNELGQQEVHYEELLEHRDMELAFASNLLEDQRRELANLYGELAQAQIERDGAIQYARQMEQQRNQAMVRVRNVEQQNSQMLDEIRRLRALLQQQQQPVYEMQGARN